MASDDFNNSPFMDGTRGVTGAVDVNLSVNPFNKDKDIVDYYGRVERTTLNSENALDYILRALPGETRGSIINILNAFFMFIIDTLKNGFAAKLGMLGTMYISSKGTVKGSGEKTKLTVKFTPSKMLKAVVKSVEIRSSAVRDVGGEIISVVDVKTGCANESLTAGGSCLVEGVGIKVTGEDSGVWFAPLAENGDASPDESMWIKVDTSLIRNQPSTLLFSLSSSLVVSKRYRVVIKTHYTGHGYERKEIIKMVSEPVTIVAGD